MKIIQVLLLPSVSNIVAIATTIFLYGYLHPRLTSTKLVKITNAILDSIEKYA